MNRDNDIESSQINLDKLLGEHGGAIDPTVMQFDFKKKSLMGRQCWSFLRDSMAASGVEKTKVFSHGRPGRPPPNSKENTRCSRNQSP